MPVLVSDLLLWRDTMITTNLIWESILLGFANSFICLVHYPHNKELQAKMVDKSLYSDLKVAERERDWA